MGAKDQLDIIYIYYLYFMATSATAGPRDTPLGPPDLTREYIALLGLFDNVCNCALELTTKTGMQASPEVLNQTLDFLTDQRGRLRIWGKNAGASGVNKASLSHRLREAPHARALVNELFQNARELLSEGSFPTHLPLLILLAINILVMKLTVCWMTYICSPRLAVVCLELGG